MSKKVVSVVIASFLTVIMAVIGLVMLVSASMEKSHAGVVVVPRPVVIVPQPAPVMPKVTPKATTPKKNTVAPVIASSTSKNRCDDQKDKCKK